MDTFILKEASAECVFIFPKAMVQLHLNKRRQFCACVCVSEGELSRLMCKCVCVQV